jgi:hypothetical protein
MALSGNAIASNVTEQTCFHFEKIERIVSPD